MEGLVMFNAWYPHIVWNQIWVKLVEFLILVLVHSAFSTVERVSPYKKLSSKYTLENLIMNTYLNPELRTIQLIGMTKKIPTKEKKELAGQS